MEYKVKKSEVLDVALKACSLGLSKSTMTSGNISARTENESFFITPSGVPADDLLDSKIVEVGFSGDFFGDYKPSSEWRFHKDIYENFEDVNAVFHMHSPYCTAIACVRRTIPAFHYMVGVAGGKNIKCADYATYGTQELSDNVVRALQGRKACLLANHGMIAVGKDLKSALKLAVEVEDLAEQYYKVLQLGSPFVIEDDEMDKILEKFTSYGNPQKA
jgi:L-fuculose-phosphate aldolase